MWICAGYLIDMWWLKWNSYCCILYFISVMEGVCNTGKYILQTVRTKCWFSSFWSLVLFPFLFEIENRPQWLDQNSNYHVRGFFSVFRDVRNLTFEAFKSDLVASFHSLSYNLCSLVIKDKWRFSQSLFKRRFIVYINVD